MTTPTVLVATWRDGLFVVAGETPDHELGHQSVRALTPDGHGGALAIVGRHALRRRTANGEWTTIAASQFEMACCVAVGDVIYVGTDDARMLRDMHGTMREMTNTLREMQIEVQMLRQNQVFGPPGTAPEPVPDDGVLPVDMSKPAPQTYYVPFVPDVPVGPVAPFSFILGYFH